MRKLLFLAFLLSLAGLLSLQACRPTGGGDDDFSYSHPDDDTIGDDDDNVIDDSHPADDSDFSDDSDDTSQPDDDLMVSNCRDPIHVNGMDLHFIGGGFPGQGGTSVAVTPDGIRYMTSTRPLQLFLYRRDAADDWFCTRIAPFARGPKLVIDNSGNFHLVFWDQSTDTLVYATRENEEWSFQHIQAYGYNIDFKIDNAGQAHLTWFDGERRTVSYATNANGSWETEDIFTFRDSDFYANPRIALSPSQELHIIFETPLMLKHAVLIGNSWTLSTIPVDSGPFAFAFDAAGTMRFAHANMNYYFYWFELFEGVWIPMVGSNPDLVYGHYENEQWVQEFSGAFPGFEMPWLIVDNEFHSHLLYESGNQYPFTYASDKAGDWNQFIFSVPGEPLSYYSLAIDGGSNAHIGYEHADGHEVIYATDESGVFTQEIVDKEDFRLGNNDLAVDTNGAEHVVMQDWSEEDLGLFENDDGNWTRTSLSLPPDFTVCDVHMQIDANGNIHIVTLGYDTLLYITNSSGEYQTESIFFADRGIEDLDMVLDADGWSHIVFGPNFSNGRSDSYYLNYGTNRGGSWTFEEITQMPIGCAGIAMSVQGSAHAVFSRAGSDELYYATNASGAWNTELVDDTAVQILACSIALDSLGFAHVTYDDDGSRIAYFENQSGTWTREILADDSSTWCRSDMIVDSADIVHIIYNTSDGLNYNLKQSGVWTKSNLLPPYVGAQKPHAMLDLQGRMHFTFEASISLWLTSFMPASEF